MTARHNPHSPAHQIRSALRSAIASLQAPFPDWDKIDKRLGIASSLTAELPATGPASAPGQPVVELQAVLQAAQQRARVKTAAMAARNCRRALEALAPFLEQEQKQAPGEACSRCRQNAAIYVRLASGQIVEQHRGTATAELLCGPCLKQDTQVLPAARALARTYRLHPATLQEIEKSTS